MLKAFNQVLQILFYGLLVVLVQNMLFVSHNVKFPHPKGCPPHALSVQFSHLCWIAVDPIHLEGQHSKVLLRA